MKRLFIISLALILVAAMSVTGIIAVSANESDNKVQKAFYVDEDNDGICDNKGENRIGNGVGAGFVDEDNDGICDNKGENCTGNGVGAGYVDEDNDGICDNKGENCGEGKGMGCGKGFGRCRNYN